MCRDAGPSRQCHIVKCVRKGGTHTSGAHAKGHDRTTLHHERGHMRKRSLDYGPVWQGSGSSKNGFGSGSSGGAASLMELEPF